MNAVITYDIAATYGTKDTDVKNKMRAQGYMESFVTPSDNKTYYLPNTTLWKPNMTPAQAKADLLSAASACNAIVERLLALEFNNNWEAIQGKPYRS